MSPLATDFLKSKFYSGQITGEELMRRVEAEVRREIASEMEQLRGERDETAAELAAVRTENAALRDEVERLVALASLSASTLSKVKDSQCNLRAQLNAVGAALNCDQTGEDAETAARRVCHELQLARSHKRFIHLTESNRIQAASAKKWRNECKKIENTCRQAKERCDQLAQLNIDCEKEICTLRTQLTAAEGEKDAILKLHDQVCQDITEKLTAAEARCTALEEMAAEQVTAMLNKIKVCDQLMLALTDLKKQLDAARQLPTP